MTLGNYRIMKPLKDEDRWFKFFTKKQLVFIAPGIILSIVLYNLFTMVGFRLGGIVAATFIIAVSLLIAMFTIPLSRYMISGGRPVYVVLYRLIRKRRKKNRVIYTKNYEHLENE